MTALGRRTPFRAGEGGLRKRESAAFAAGLATAGRVLLADVSEWQPDINDAAYLAWSKAIVIRAAYGDAHDDRAWYGGARRAALHQGGVRWLGIYQYLVQGQSVAQQFAEFRRLVGSLQDGEVPVCDLEEGTDGAAKWTEWHSMAMQAWPQLARRPARGQPLLYSYLSFSQEQGLHPGWMADYTTTEPSDGHWLWQFTSKFSVPGAGVTDCSVFHGSIDELASYNHPAAAPRPAPAPVPSPVPAPDPPPAPAPSPEENMVELDTTVASHPLLIPFGTSSMDLLSTATETDPCVVEITFLDLGARAHQYSLSWGGGGAQVTVPPGNKKARLDVVSGGGLPVSVRFNQ